MMTPGNAKATGKVIAAIVTALVIGIAVTLGTLQVLRWKDAAQQNEQRGTTLTTASAITADGSRADSERAADTAGIAAGATEYHTTIDEERRNDPLVLDRTTRTVPVGVRNAHKARRLARERLGCVTRECEARSNPGAAAER